MPSADLPELQRKLPAGLALTTQAIRFDRTVWAWIGVVPFAAGMSSV